MKKSLPRLLHLAGMVLLATIYYYFFVYDIAQHLTKKTPPLNPALLFIACTSLILYVCMAHRWLWALVWSIFCLSGFLTKYAIIYFGAKVDINILSYVTEANFGEVSTILNSSFSLYLAYGVGLSIFGYVLMHFIRNRAHCQRTLLESLGVSTMILVFIYASSTHEMLPYQLFKVSYQNLTGSYKIADQMRKRKDIGRTPAALEKTEQDPLYVVLVIGESARSDHFSLNGYVRDTNRYLQAMSNIISHPKAYACDTWTIVSIPCMLTRATARNRDAMYKETSLISVFKALGFETTWLSGQGRFWFMSPTTFIRKESHTDKSFNIYGGYDEVMLPDYKQQLAKTTPQLIVMHLNGSHFHYQDRYPKDFKKFTQLCSKAEKLEIANEKTLIGRNGCGWNHLVNNYDNSLLYTDWLLAETITQLKYKNALFLYVSDHGEFIGKNGGFGHGSIAPPEVWHVPMIWWASDRFIELHPEAWSTLQATREQKVSHDNVFHSLLGCIGVKSKLIDDKLNLCNPPPAPALPPVVTTAP